MDRQTGTERESERERERPISIQAFGYMVNCHILYPGLGIYGQLSYFISRPRDIWSLSIVTILHPGLGIYVHCQLSPFYIQA